MLNSSYIFKIYEQNNLFSGVTDRYTWKHHSSDNYYTNFKMLYDLSLSTIQLLLTITAHFAIIQLLLTITAHNDRKTKYSCKLWILWENLKCTMNHKFCLCNLHILQYIFFECSKSFHTVTE